MRRNVLQLLKKRVSVKNSDGTTYSGTLDLSDDNGVWITVDPACAPNGAPASVNLMVFFPFAQMYWLAVADD